MHIGLNLVFLVPGESSGPETYVRELIPALLDERPDLRLTAFINREASEAGDGPWGELVPSVTVPVRARRRTGWVWGEQQLLPRLAQRAGVELLHSLLNTGPAWGSFRRVVTIHDLIYRIHPAAHSLAPTIAMRMLVPLAARSADRIIVPSETTRRDVIRLLGVDASKIDLVPQGGGIATARRAESGELLRGRYELGTRPIVLTVSLKRKHKNLERLLDALALIPHERRPALVLAGHATPYERHLRAHAQRLGVAPDTRFLGWVPHDELEGLYRASTCFVFPSLYEGFGLPVLEAMMRGVPVACSNRGALTEVADDAALTFDPEQPREIAAAIERLLADPGERERLSRAGEANAGRYSWAETARRTLASYESALAYSRKTT
jgi:glycosyltransferase involved in cell wall biosynthesis